MMQRLIQPLDDLLNSLTMYRLLLYGLGIVAAVAVLFSVTGVLHYSPVSLLYTLIVLLISCYVGNRILAWIYGVTPNSESALITALILFCIISPVRTSEKLVLIGLAGGIAMAAKYVFAPWGKHIFNPAAIAVVITEFMGVLHANWWIGNKSMLPFTLILGVLVIRKIRRTQLFLVFAIVALAVNILVSLANGLNVAEGLKQAIVSGPLIFLGTIMLTEPATMPPTKYLRLAYGAFVAILFAAPLHVGSIYTVPDLALVIGNLLAFAVTPKKRYLLTLKEKIQIGPTNWDYIFTSNRRLKFIAGQYMEWTLPVHHQDGRGNRRTFTVASAPTEATVHLGVKFYEPSSRYKATLKDMAPGDYLFAGQVAGDFTLPSDANKPLLFIAGGIGITPFRSIVQQLITTNQKRDIILLYAANTVADLSYHEVFERARDLGVRMVPVIAKPDAAWEGHQGFITTGILAQEVPDLKNRMVYISGPNVMVVNYRRMLRSMGVKRRYIHTDYFSGY